MSDFQLGQLDAIMGVTHQDGKGNEYDRGYSDGYTRESINDHMSEAQNA